jgi:long-chain acyl-CoA synthetase
MFRSVAHMMFNSIEQHASRNALLIKRSGILQTYTYQQLGESIRSLTHGFLEQGLQAGDRVAILSNNMPEWTITDFAVFCMRGVVVPLYQTLPPAQIAYILKDAGARCVCVQNRQQYGKIMQVKADLPQLEYIFTFENWPEKPDFIRTFDHLLESGRRHRVENPNHLQQSLDAIRGEDLCSLVYTSGTTGEPKGVMLNHKGFVTDIINAESVLNLYADDVFLSFLPLSHLYERLAGHWCPLYRGAAIYYAESIETVIRDIAEARPTVMVSVPRLYEKVAAAVYEQVEKSSALKRNLFYWALNTGLRYHQKRIEGKVSGLLEKKYQLADKIVFTKIKTKLGGRFRCPIAGGAPLSVDTLKFFEAIGLRIVEGYGMTETHLIITLTPPGKTKYGSCGKPIPGVEVKISGDGEVQVKGDILMQGYYKRPELTREVIDEDGWLHTGDVGYLDEDRYLFLTDRKKNIIVTSGGKNVAPAPIEHMLKTSRYIDEVCLVGNRQRFIGALIIPNFELLKKWATEQGIDVTNLEKLLAHDKVNQLLWQEIEERQKSFARYEAVKKFVLLAEPFQIEKEELTPSLKIKRNVVEKKYADVIAKMYQSS